MGELNATGAGGIDLRLERRNLLIGGRAGGAITINTINGSIPGPMIHMIEGREALIRVHNLLPESARQHEDGSLPDIETPQLTWPVTATARSSR